MGLFYQGISSSKLCRRMNLCIQVTEEVNTEKESKETGESVRGCCSSFDNGNREHWEALWVVRGRPAAELTDRVWWSPKMRASEIQLGKSGMRVLVFSSPSFPREVIHLALSQLYLLHSWEAEFLYLVAKCIKSNPANLSQLHSFSLEICPSANGAPDSVGEELRHCWAALG